MATNQENYEPCGYPLDICEGDVDSKFLCGYCKQLLKEPIQSFCGHRFCKDGIQLVISENVNFTCPMCVEDNIINEQSTLQLETTFPDNAIRREMLMLQVKCVNPGCDWRGIFKDYHFHIIICSYAVIKCEICGNMVPKIQIDDHLTRGCHDNKCLFGCPEEVDDHEKHKSKEITKHVDLLHMKIKDIQKVLNVKSNQKLLEKQSLRIPELSKDVTRQDTKLTELTNTISGMHLQIDQLEKTVNQIDVSKGLEAHKECNVLDNKVKTFEGIIAVLNNQIENCLGRFNRLENMVEVEKRKRQEAEKKVLQLERTITLKDVTITELDLKTQLLELSSFNGVLMWKVTEFSKRRREAVEGKLTSIYSQPFYTSRTGYKLCARLYLNGDGSGKGSHLSLFFVVMRGHYDALQKWPFTQKVTMMMLNQDNGENIVDAFRPDPKSSSFTRPQSDMNIASGCPMFAPVSILDSGRHAYVKDDTAFIKVIVDTPGLP